MMRNDEIKVRLLFNSDNYENKCKWGSGSKLKYGGINTK